MANELHIMALVTGFDTVYTDGVAFCCVAGLASGNHDKSITERHATQANHRKTSTTSTRRQAHQTDSNQSNPQHSALLVLYQLDAFSHLTYKCQVQKFDLKIFFPLLFISSSSLAITPVGVYHHNEAPPPLSIASLWMVPALWFMFLISAPQVFARLSSVNCFLYRRE